MCLQQKTSLATEFGNLSDYDTKNNFSYYSMFDLHCLHRNEFRIAHESAMSPRVENGPGTVEVEWERTRLISEPHSVCWPVEAETTGKGDQ